MNTRPAFDFLWNAIASLGARPERQDQIPPERASEPKPYQQSFEEPTTVSAIPPILNDLQKHDIGAVAEEWRKKGVAAGRGHDTTDEGSFVIATLEKAATQAARERTLTKKQYETLDARLEAELTAISADLRVLQSDADIARGNEDISSETRASHGTLGPFPQARQELFWAAVLGLMVSIAPTLTVVLPPMFFGMKFLVAFALAGAFGLIVAYSLLPGEGEGDAVVSSGQGAALGVAVGAGFFLVRATAARSLREVGAAAGLTLLEIVIVLYLKRVGDGLAPAQARWRKQAAAINQSQAVLEDDIRKRKNRESRVEAKKAELRAMERQREGLVALMDEAKNIDFVVRMTLDGYVQGWSERQAVKRGAPRMKLLNSANGGVQ